MSRLTAEPICRQRCHAVAELTVSGRGMPMRIRRFAPPDSRFAADAWRSASSKTSCTALRHSRKYGDRASSDAFSMVCALVEVHPLLEGDDLAEEFLRLLRVKAGDESNEPLNGSLLIGEQVFPFGQLLIHERKKRERHALEDTTVQRILNVFR